MSTLTLSRFAKAMTGTQEKPAQTPLAPVSAPSAIVAPAVVEKPQQAAKTEVPALVQVETVAAPANIQPTTTAKPAQENEMGKKEDLLAKQEKLRADLAAADKELAELRNAERADVLAKIRGMMDEYEIRSDELSGRSAAQRKAGLGTVRGPAAVKFKDPATGQTWSGRGQQAAWLKAAIASGKKLDDFEV